ncbi:translocation/assembly module TamB domain-containing protein [Vibrio maerlii]|uniref:autotransporter assembly complex protein TamB n=1 Tax=Vibrio maerlii TaxID=2231648 RepID=UPI000E3C5790|nr:translocation/assembly module TamB domain-containing protein [Vibrio maerlii]
MSISRKLLKGCKWMTISLFMLVVILLVSIGLLLFTNPGLKGALWVAEKFVPQLKVAEAEGAIFPQFTLSGVEFVDESLYITTKVESATLGVTPSCFTTPAVCVDTVQLFGVDVVLSDIETSGEETSVEPSKPSLIALPVSISLNQLIAQKINLDILGHKISWQSFESGASWSGSQLSLSQTTFDGLQVELAPSSGDEAAVSNSEPEPESSTDQMITLPDVYIPLLIDIERFDLTQFNYVAESPIKVDRLSLEGSAGEYDVDVRLLELEMPQVDGQLSAQIELKGDYPLNLNTSATIKESDLRGQYVELSAQGSVGKLELDLLLDKLIKGELTGEIQPLDPTFPFDLAAKDFRAQWPLTGKSDYQTEIAILNANGNLDGYRVDLAAKAGGTQIPDIDLAVKGEGTLEQIDLSELVLKTLGGEVTGQIMANWAEPINWQADIDLSHIQPGLQWQEAEGDISGQLKTRGQLTPQGGWRVEPTQVDITGIFREYPIDIEGDLTAQDIAGKGEFEFDTSGLTVAHGVNKLFAQGRLQQNWDLGLSLDLPDLSLSVPDAKGRVNGQISLAGKFNEPEVKLDLQAGELAWQELVALSSLSIKGEAVPLPVANVDLVVQATNIKAQGETIDSVDLSLKGQESQHQLSLDVASKIISTQIRVSGNLDRSKGIVWDGELDRAEITTEQGPWTLEQAVAIKYDSNTQQVDVAKHCWEQQNAHLCLIKDLQAGESGEAYVDIRNFEFSQIAKYVPQVLDLQGSVTASTWAKWSPEAKPEAKVSIRLPKGRVVQQSDTPVTLGWEQAAVNASLLAGDVKADWLIDIVDNGDVSGELSIPDIQGNAPQIDARLALSTFNIDFIQPLLGEYSNAALELETDLRLSGPLMHPQVRGQLSIADLSVEGDIAPVEIKDGSVFVEFKGYQADLNATIDTPDGQLKVSGDADWQDLDDWSTNARVFADELKVVVPPMVDVIVKPDMTFSMTPKLARVDGDIKLPWGRILVEELPASAISVSKDQVLLDKDLKPLNEDQPLPISIQTNINISIGDDFELRALGLNSDLVGNLKVSQRDQGPYIVGEVNLVDGTYRSFGQDLIINEGKILMNGPVDEPYVAIEAIRNPDNTQDDVTAGVRVSGPASEPEVTIFSDPAMPQANALSYLLRGQDIDGESGGNAMTTTLIGLSLARSGQVVGDIGEAFGVQDLQLDTAGTGDDSQVTVSGYILPGLQVKYGVGIFDSVGEFTVRYRLMKDLYIEAISGLDSAVDLLYQFEFN